MPKTLFDDSTPDIDHVWKKVWDEYNNLSTQRAVLHTTVSRLRSKLTACEELSIAADENGYLLTISAPSAN